MADILVTGATGTLGREVVAQALKQRASVRALVRGATNPLSGTAEIVPGDLLTGAELPEAMAGVDAIVHCATGFGPESDAELVAARNMIDTARKAGAPHVVYISIVGVDKSAFSYFRAKYEVEQLIRQSGLPFTILRATQFHGFVLNFIRSCETDGSIHLPKGLAFQPIAVTEVAAELVALALKPAQGSVPSMAGPQVLTLEDMARAYVEIMQPGLVVHTAATEIASEYHDAFRSLDSVAPDRAVGHLTWEAYLQAQKQEAASAARQEVLS